MSNKKCWFYCVYIFNSFEELLNSNIADENWTIIDNEDGRALDDINDFIYERTTSRSKIGKETHYYVRLKCMEVGENNESL